MLWIVDELLSENSHPGAISIAQAARDIGHNVISTKYVPLTNGAPFANHYDFKFNGKKISPFALYEPTNEPTVVHGTIEFCKLFEKECGRLYTPGLYFNDNVKHWSRYAHQIEARDLLNRDYNIISYGEFVRRQYNKAGMTCFVKPESGLKQFTGQVIEAASFEDGLKKLSPYGELDDTMLVVVSPVQAIKAEFRYVIANKKMITGSQYRWDNKLDVRIDTDGAADILARRIAQANWQADSVYVCDIALDLGGNPKVIELNAFSSSGLYACDTHKIVEAVSSAAMKEWSGELEDE